MTFRIGTGVLSRTLLALILIGLFTSHGNSQTTPVGPAPIETKTTSAEERAPIGGSDAPKHSAQDGGKCDGKAPCPISEKIKSLWLGLPARFARGFQYEYKLFEQPGTVLVSQGSGTGAITAFLRNPEHNLQQHTVTFKFGELFPERLSMFKHGSDYLKKYPEAADPNEALPEILCGYKPLITCLTKGGSWWKRALMGTSVNISFSERAAVQQGVIAISPVFGKHYQFNGGFTFDPAKLFPTATNWKSTFDDVQKIDKALALLGSADVISGPRPWKHPWTVAIIPKVEFKVLSQFDFLKFEGALIAAPFPERALNTWTFTWDLTRAIPDTKSRIDADAIDEALLDLQNKLGVEEKNTPQKWCILYLPNQEVRQIENVHPAFSAGLCQDLAKMMNAEKYQLSCVLKGKQGAADQRADGPKTSRVNPPVPPPGNSCQW